MDLREFFLTVVTTEQGWFCLSHASAERDTWREEFYGWPDDIDKVLRKVEELNSGNNVYFSPFLFSDKRALKSLVLPTRTIVADLDEANLLTVPIKPTVLVETSTERHQGYWVLRHQADTQDRHEELSKRLTYSIPRCDRTGWFLGKRVRVPTTYNWKYTTGPQLVRVVDSNAQQHDPDQFDMLPVVSLAEGLADGETDNGWIEAAEEQGGTTGPQELLAMLRTKLPSKVVATYDREIVGGEGRSGALWALMTSAFRAGASREQVYVLAKNSANNKFRDLRYGGTRELAKDVLRAEANVKSATPDLRSKLMEARRVPGLQAEKKAYIAHLVQVHMSKIGNFVHCADGTLWFVREDTGRPIAIMQRSESLQVYLDTMFGLNATEPESSYTINSLIAFVSELVPSGLVASMSHFDVDSQTLFLHTGRRDVLMVSKAGIRDVINGYQGVVFPWMPGSDVLTPVYSALSKSWNETLLGDCLDNLVGLERDHAMALLRSWIIMLVLRTMVISRPILALFGQPGAGKSTLFRRLYTLFYGRNKALGAVSTPEDFDFACATDPLVVLDNVDTWERWLPDRLALAAASSTLIRRKLYTNGEVVAVQRQAFLGITAHSPSFGREDVVDRLILLTFERLTEFKSETQILDAIFKQRNALWGAILEEIQRVLAAPFPSLEEVPQFRVEDFSRTGYWIAKAAGCHEEFRGAIEALQREQKKFSIEEDHLLVEAIQDWLVRCKDPDEFRTPGQLWTLLELTSKDPVAFNRRYRNSVGLGKKLWSLQETMRQLFDVEWNFDAARGSRAWRFRIKAGRNGTAT